MIDTKKAVGTINDANTFNKFTSNTNLNVAFHLAVLSSMKIKL
jgi:hypothetical protein